ncbi:HAMP domain-containing histidine kinase, partial [Candidatus Roizmanbacteria bacterium]|nr:HAMP domain-containing histidine kinase [Candidatus Roizmanbacteria bacterium]
MFKSARIKLTAWYLLIIMFISMSFSLVIYRVLTREFERFERQQRFRIERRFYNENIPPNFMHRFPLPLDPELIKEIRQRLTFILIIINGGILLVSGGLGYFLAGRTLQPIKDMVDEQNRFISDSSHELRTPLTSLKTGMEVTLRDKNLSLQQAKKLISENIGEVDKLQSLSDQLLRLAQYEKLNGNLQFEKISLSKIVEEAVRKIAPLVKQKQISIKKDLKDVEIKGNKESLVDLFVILLDNAIKYSPKERKIEIKIEKTDGF